jgi:hypothetical protein
VNRPSASISSRISRGAAFEEAPRSFEAMITEKYEGAYRSGDMDAARLYSCFLLETCPIAGWPPPDRLCLPVKTSETDPKNDEEKANGGQARCQLPLDR